MKADARYQQGQRWEFDSDVFFFEKTLVIGHVNEAQPESSSQETTYHVYVRFSEAGTRWLLPDRDGIVLSLTAEGLDRSVTQLIEDNVQLPWWWVHGRRLEREEDAPRLRTPAAAETVSEPLHMIFYHEKSSVDPGSIRQRAIAWHREKFSRPTLKRARSASVAESWLRMSAWMEEHAPDHEFVLNPGASEAAIAEFERGISATVPVDFRESYRLHDGGNCSFPPGAGDFLSLEQILAAWRMYKGWQRENGYAIGEDWIPRAILGPIKPVFWNPRRIYITDNSGDHLTLDLDPPEDGVYGQILDHSHEVGPTTVLAPSWGDYLAQLVDDMENGKYVYFDFDGSLEFMREDMRQ